MADQEPTTAGNGSGEGGDEPQVAILAQYIKDLSVENPSAPQVFQWQVQPSLDVQFNINVEKAGDDVHEVVAQDRSLRAVGQRRPFRRRPELRRAVRAAQRPGGSASARSCWSKRRG